MMFCFAILAPLGIVAARFCRHRPHISHLHGTAMSVTGELVLAAACVALFTTATTPVFATHRVIGFTIAILVILTIVLAIVFSRMRASRTSSSRLWTHLRLVHAVIGWAVLLLGWANIALGLRELWPQYLVPYYAWVGAIIFAFVVAETIALSRQQLSPSINKYFNFLRFGSPVAPAPLTGAHELKRAGYDDDVADGAARVTVAPVGAVGGIPSSFQAVASALAGDSEGIANLPVMDCSDLMTRNNAHSSLCLVVVGGFVLDVTSFLEDHPGGAGLIYAHRGTDITRFFPDHGSPEALEAHRRGHHVHSLRAIALLSAYRVGIARKKPTPAENGDGLEGVAIEAKRVPTLRSVALSIFGMSKKQPEIVAGGDSRIDVIEAKPSTRMRCVSVTPEDTAGHVKTFVFEAPQFFTYVAGQHAVVLFTCDAGGKLVGDGCKKTRESLSAVEGDAAATSQDETLARRTWTISLHPSVSQGRIAITVKRVGKFSGWLHDSMQPGLGAIELDSVAGTFTPRLTHGSGRPVLLIAAGIGITPFRAMIPDLLAPGSQPLTLVYSVRTLAEAVFVPELIASLGPAHCLVTATGEAPGSAWAGRRGRVDAAMLREAAPGGDVAACDVFLCGPEAFMDATRAMLAGLGHPTLRCFSESFD